MMALDVYWGSGSPYAWRVLLALAIKQASYNSHLIEFSKGDHKTPQYLALNPRGKVPTLKDGDYVLGESLAIVVYLDRKFPEPPLFGRSAAESGRIWQSISGALYYMEQPARRVVGPILFGKIDEKRDDIQAAIKEVHDELARLEATLGAHAWLAGETISAADVVAYPFLELLLRAAGKDSAAPLDLGLLPLAKPYPAIDRWRAQITKMPGYDKTYPPHWRETPSTGRPLAAAS